MRWPCWPTTTEEQSNIKEIYCFPWSLNKNICIIAKVTKYPKQECCHFFYLSGKSLLKRCSVSKIDLRSEIYHRCENYKVILLPVVKIKRQHFIIQYRCFFQVNVIQFDFIYFSRIKQAIPWTQFQRASTTLSGELETQLGVGHIVFYFFSLPN